MQVVDSNIEKSAVSVDVSTPLADLQRVKLAAHRSAWTPGAAPAVNVIPFPRRRIPGESPLRNGMRVLGQVIQAKEIPRGR